MKTKNLQMYYLKMKIVLISVTLVTSLVKSYAENPYVSFLIMRDITGSGLGGNICPSISLTHNRSSFSIGPNFQRKNLNSSGIQLNYKYSVAKNYTEMIELYFYGNLMVHTAAYTGTTRIETEKSTYTGGTASYEYIKLKVIEGYGGLGLQINLSNYFSVASSIGLGMYNTLNANCYAEKCREKSATCLQLQFSLIYNFKSKI